MKRILLLALFLLCGSAFGQMPMAAGLTGGDLESLLNDGNTAAFYRADKGITQANFPETVSAWTNRIGAVPSLTQGTGALQPYLALYSGTKYVRSWGAGNSLLGTTVVITGNVTITADLAMDDWTPAANSTIVNRNISPDGISIQILSTGRLRLIVGDGASNTSYDSTAAPVVTDGTRHTIQAIYTDGGSGNVIFKIDGAQLGTTVATAKTMTNASGMTIRLMPSANSTGKLYSAQITNGSSTTYYNFDASFGTDGNATMVSADGITYTLGGGTAAINHYLVGANHILFAGDTVNQFLRTGASARNQPRTIYIFLREPSWTSANVLMDDDSLGIAQTMSLVQHTGTPKIQLFAGNSTTNLDNANLAIATWGTVTLGVNGASSFVQVGTGTAASGDAGANNASGITLGADGQTVISKYGNMRIKCFVDRSAADNAAKRLAIQQAMAQQCQAM